MEQQLHFESIDPPEYPRADIFLDAVRHEVESGSLSFDDLRDLCTEYVAVYPKNIIEQLISSLELTDAVTGMMLGALVERRYEIEDGRRM